ncbi:energy transducer TonB [Desulfuromonas thiophila]|uniref:Protein TonB n=1 Tax=Desulfuromonas thiophila TaxID=57664 RepID=A0A1G6X6F7_9BACT|nr:energy transducer TonB [Desulfuromonas thiophila]SDD72925.1 outer membrane transport energization protein TonB [Desulfuromonas thiophila]
MRSDRHLLLALLLALLVNGGLFVLLPQLVQEKPTRPQQLRRQAVALTRLPPPVEPLQAEETPPEAPRPPEVKPLPLPTPLPLPGLVRQPPQPQLQPLQPQLVPALVSLPLPPVALPAVAAPDRPFAESEVDQPPQIRFRPEPGYPWQARRQRIEGQVEVELVVDRDGCVEQARVIAAEPAELFDAAVLAVVRQWRFQPAQLQGQPVASRLRQVVVFRLDEEGGGRGGWR